MRQFIKEVLPFREKFVNITIHTREILKMQEEVLSALELNNLNKLRDKFEGVYFYNNFLLKSLSLIALEKHLKQSLVNWDNIDAKEFNAVIKKDGVDLDIISCDYGNLPLINSNNTRPALITMKMKGDRNVLICGYASPAVLNHYQNKDYTVGIVSTQEKTVFTGFQELRQFSSFEELEYLHQEYLMAI